MIKSEYIEPDLFEHLIYALTPENRLVCRLCLSTGLRVGDVVSLRSDSLKKRMTVTESKTGKKKRITLSDKLLKELQANAGKIYVFEHRTDENRHRTRQAVYADIKRASKAFRLKENLTPHSLRKIYAVKIYQRTGDIEKVREALNHDSDAVTMIYAYADELLKQKQKKKRRS